MKDTNKEIEMTSKQLKIQTSAILELLNGETNLEEYYFLLFLISLYKDGIISTEILSEGEDDVYDKIVSSIEASDESIRIHYLAVFNSFLPTLKKLKTQTLDLLLRHITERDKHTLNKIFDFYFENSLDQFALIQGRISGESFQPREITNLIYSLSELPEHARVFNPYGGFASFGFKLTDDQIYVGQEINSKTWAIAILRLLAHDKLKTSSYSRVDSITNWPEKTEKFDLVVASPPFNQKFNFTNANGSVGSNSVEQFIIEKGVDSLKENGKLIVVLPQGFLFKGGNAKQLRKQLIEEDLIDTIILLPTGLYRNTAISTVILVIDKAKLKKQKVRFVDASDFVSRLYTGLKKLDYEKLTVKLKSRADSTETESIILIDNSVIRDNDYNLNVRRYFQSSIEGSKLRQFVKVVDRKKSKSNIGKVARIKDLKDDRLNYNLNTYQIEEAILGEGNFRKVEESCLLVATRGERLKPTLFHYQSIPIYIGPEILALKIDEKQVYEAYLINELHADYVKTQLAAIMQGAVIPMIKQDDLLEVVIKLPSMEEQRAIANTTIEAYHKHQQLEIELSAKMQTIKDDARREFQSIKHTFRQFLSALKSNVSGTRKFLLKNQGNPISMDMIYSNNLNQTFDNHLLSVNNLIDGLNSLLNDEITFSKEKLILNLLEIVTAAQQNFKLEEKFIFNEIYFDNQAFTDDEGNEMLPLIQINEVEFNTLFSNVISNAVIHGFKNSQKNNIIKCAISLDNNFCILEIANNGKPLPIGFTLQHLTTRGEKTTDSPGIGIGGADIKAIVEKYSGYLEIANDPESEFPVIYILKFPFIKPSLL